MTTQELIKQLNNISQDAIIADKDGNLRFQIKDGKVVMLPEECTYISMLVSERTIFIDEIISKYAPTNQDILEDVNLESYFDPFNDHGEDHTFTYITEECDENKIFSQIKSKLISFFGWKSEEDFNKNGEFEIVKNIPKTLTSI